MNRSNPSTRLQRLASFRSGYLAEVLSKHHVAGVVTESSLALGLLGLVPARQSIRLLIDKYLVGHNLV